MPVTIAPAQSNPKLRIRLHSRAGWRRRVVEGGWGGERVMGG